MWPFLGNTAVDLLGTGAWLNKAAIKKKNKHEMDEVVTSKNSVLAILFLEVEVAYFKIVIQSIVHSIPKPIT